MESNSTLESWSGVCGISCKIDIHRSSETHFAALVRFHFRTGKPVCPQSNSGGATFFVPSNILSRHKATPKAEASGVIPLSIRFPKASVSLCGWRLAALFLFDLLEFSLGDRIVDQHADSG